MNRERKEESEWEESNGKSYAIEKLCIVYVCMYALNAAAWIFVFFFLHFLRRPNFREIYACLRTLSHSFHLIRMNDANPSALICMSGSSGNNNNSNSSISLCLLVLARWCFAGRALSYINTTIYSIYIYLQYIRLNTEVYIFESSAQH